MSLWGHRFLERSQIIKASGEPVKVDYMMRRNGESWLISDIYLDGAIGEVATRRSEFSTILKNEGIDGLIVALNRKADILTGTTAKTLELSWAVRSGSTGNCGLAERVTTLEVHVICYPP